MCGAGFRGIHVLFGQPPGQALALDELAQVFELGGVALLTRQGGGDRSLRLLQFGPQRLGRLLGLVQVGFGHLQLGAQALNL